MTVSYQSTEEDARRSYYDAIQRQENFGTTMVRLAIASVIGFPIWRQILPHVDLAPQTSSLALLFGGFVALTAIAYGLIMGWNRFARRLIFRHQLKTGHYKKAIGDLKVTLGENGVREEYPNGSIFTAWAGVIGVEEQKDYLGIQLESSYWHWIPWSAFSSAEEGKAFASLARERMEAARSS